MNSKIKYFIKLFMSLIAIVALVCLDIYTKLISVLLFKDQKPMVLINGVLELTYLENKGAAFGIMQGRIPFFLILTPVVVLLIVFSYVMLLRTNKYTTFKACLLFLCAGAIGNFLDRLSLGYVRDMIYFKLINFPVFNVADIYVTCSVVVIIFIVLFIYKENDFDEILNMIRVIKRGKN